MKFSERTRTTVPSEMRFLKQGTHQNLSSRERGTSQQKPREKNSKSGGSLITAIIRTDIFCPSPEGHGPDSFKRINNDGESRRRRRHLKNVRHLWTLRSNGKHRPRGCCKAKNDWYADGHLPDRSAMPLIKQMTTIQRR